MEQTHSLQMGHGAGNTSIQHNIHEETGKKPATCGPVEHYVVVAATMPLLPPLLCPSRLLQKTSFVSGRPNQAYQLGEDAGQLLHFLPGGEAPPPHPATTPWDGCADVICARVNQDSGTTQAVQACKQMWKHPVRRPSLQGCESL